MKGLQLLAQVFANALARKRADEKLYEHLQEIENLKQRLEAENIYLQEEIKLLADHSEIVSQSLAMKKVLSQAEQVARTDSTVLIQGETGTGKELVARAIHQKSGSAKGPFVALNCGAFPREILENELFGHEKGAFTGAINEKAGAFELADGGSLFLDEVAEMEPDVQVKFLRALEQRSFRRLGGKKEIEVDIRVIAATNRNVEDALKSGDLREDLYHRLAVIPIYLPPLRERAGDVLLLANEFLARFSRDHSKELDGFSEGAIEFLQTYSWPGNVRELRNHIERAVILAKGDQIETSDLQLRQGIEDREVHIPVGTSLQEAERLLTLKTYAFSGGDPGKTARILGIKEKELRERLLTYLETPVAAS